MKKIKILIFFAMMFSYADNMFAQTEKGNLVINGSSNFGFSSLDTSPKSTTRINFDLRPGYFVINNLATGLGFTWERQSRGRDKSSLTTIGPWARYYLNSGFYAGVSYRFAKEKAETTLTTGSISGNLLELELGYAHFFNDHVAIQPAFVYSDAGGDFNGTTIGLNVSLGIYF